MKVKSGSHSVVSNSLWPHGLQTTRLLCPCHSPGKKTGMGCHFLLQGIFLTQGSKPCLLGLLHCRQILYCWYTGELFYHEYNYIISTHLFFHFFFLFLLLFLFPSFLVYFLSSAFSPSLLPSLPFCVCINMSIITLCKKMINRNINYTELGTRKGSFHALWW